MTATTHDDPDALVRLMLDAVPDLLLLCRIESDTLELRIVDVNRTALDVLGVSREELIGERPRALIPGREAFEDPEARRAIYAELRRLGVLELPQRQPLAIAAGDKTAVRIRLVWPDVDRDYLLVVAELVAEDPAA